LAQLGRELAAMCTASATAMGQATTALLQADLGLAEQVLTGDAALDERRARCEDHAYSLVAFAGAGRSGSPNGSRRDLLRGED
jgi:phosphate transport system protein